MTGFRYFVTATRLYVCLVCSLYASIARLSRIGALMEWEIMKQELEVIKLVRYIETENPNSLDARGLVQRIKGMACNSVMCKLQRVSKLGPESSQCLSSGW
ncbi:hypothetical protein EDC01DRAFT_665803 [Geopyxis carbonaria]|nr:hypothetical protein EDC01DRAFT_665803 [Geopyxis carbonaria]